MALNRLHASYKRISRILSEISLILTNNITYTSYIYPMNVASVFRLLCMFSCALPIFSVRFATTWKQVTAATLASSAFLTSLPAISHADELVIKGTVSLSQGAVPVFAEKSALYVTAKEDFGVAGTILQQRAPPVMTKKLTGLKYFPVDVKLSDSLDQTAEGLANPKWKTGAKPLVISVRFDVDGDASTRSPDDLVGKGSSNKIKEVEGGWEDFSVTLEGRGVAGKFLTNTK